MCNTADYSFVKSFQQENHWRRNPHKLQARWRRFFLGSWWTRLLLKVWKSQWLWLFPLVTHDRWHVTHDTWFLWYLCYYPLMLKYFMLPICRFFLYKYFALLLLLLVSHQMSLWKLWCFLEGGQSFLKIWENSKKN